MLSLERWQRTRSRWRTRWAQPAPHSSGTSWPSRFLALPLTGPPPHNYFPLKCCCCFLPFIMLSVAFVLPHCPQNHKLTEFMKLSSHSLEGFLLWVEKVVVGPMCKFFTFYFFITVVPNDQGTNRLSAVVHRLHRDSLQLQPPGRPGESFKDALAWWNHDWKQICWNSMEILLVERF